MKNPIINSPYKEPIRHFKADERGISDEILEYRRPSSFYIPVPRTRKKDRQLELVLAEGAYGEEMQKENEFINKIRGKIKEWRDGGYAGITKTSRDLLFYWQDKNRENKLFFCQLVSQTLIHVNEYSIFDMR